MNSEVVFWVALAVVLGVIEASTVNMVTIWPTLSALITAIFAATGLGMAAQATVFVVCSALLLLLTRPFVKRVLVKKTYVTNADRIIGAEGVVIEKIDAMENSGQVKVMGQVWSAKAEDGAIIEMGSRITVLKLEGVKAVVSVIK